MVGRTIFFAGEQKGKKAMFGSVNANDPTMILSTLGHPHDFPNALDVLDGLRDGDYVVVMAAERPFGAIYFMRPREEGRVPDVYFEGDVLGAYMILTPSHRMKGEKFLRDWVEKRFKLVHHEGRNMDGCTQSFFVLRSR